MGKSLIFKYLEGGGMVFACRSVRTKKFLPAVAAFDICNKDIEARRRKQQEEEKTSRRSKKQRNEKKKKNHHSRSAVTETEFATTTITRVTPPPSGVFFARMARTRNRGKNSASLGT
jgi:hypothetical protein